MNTGKNTINTSIKLVIIGLSIILSMTNIENNKVHADLRIIYVDWDASGNNDGSSWADAYTDLQDALMDAIAGDEIWVAAGTYKPTTTDDRSISFELNSGVEIYGGFPAAGGDWESRDWGKNITSLSGEMGVSEYKTDNSYHVVVAKFVGSDTILDGFTISEGCADKEEDKGGGMFNDHSFLLIENVIFEGNWASCGGGMYNFYSNPIMTNITFSRNVSFGEGGGMYNDHSNPSIISSIFYNNPAADLGGGMHNADSNPTLLDVTFSSSVADFRGGGIYNSSSNPSLTNVSFRYNHADGADELWEGEGGAIYNRGSNPTLTNITFSGNTADNGSAIRNFMSSPIIINSTFTCNSADNSSGGIDNSNDSNPILINTILWDNFPDQITNNESSPNITYSIIQGGYIGTGNLEEDPLLGPLADNGGFTLTHALLEGSPAIDAGDPETCPETDQRGVLRPQGEGCDIGAYEFEVAVESQEIYLPIILR